MIEICNLRKEKPKYSYDIKVDMSSVLGNPFEMRSEKNYIEKSGIVATQQV